MKQAKPLLQKTIIILVALLIVALFFAVLLYIGFNSLPAIQQIGIRMFLSDTQWRPVSNNAQFGLLPVILGTLYVSLVAMICSMVFGIGCAFFLQYYANKTVQTLILSVIDSVAGIPSVIFGFFGLSVIVPLIATTFSLPAGQCILAAGIILGIMLIPFVVSGTYESISQAREMYESAALALGFKREYCIIRIILPSIRTGLISASMMAFGRGLAETMAVMMVIGNTPIFPRLLGRGQTIPALTALEMGSIEYNSMHLSVLYTANAVLLIMLFLVLGMGYALMRRGKKE